MVWLLIDLRISYYYGSVSMIGFFKFRKRFFHLGEVLEKGELFKFVSGSSLAVEIGIWILRGASGWER